MIHSIKIQMTIFLLCLCIRSIADLFSAIFYDSSNLKVDGGSHFLTRAGVLPKAKAIVAAPEMIFLGHAISLEIHPLCSI